MIYLRNGIKVINQHQFRDIWISISDFGLETDHNSIFGLSHLLEHVLITADPRDYVFNGYTTRTGMVFWCKAKPHLTKHDAVYELLSWFFHEDGRMKVDSITESLDNYFDEIEHEWYYRQTMFNMKDPIYVMQGMDMIMCGRRNDFIGQTEYIRKSIRNRLLELTAGQVTVMCSELDQEITEVLNLTWGTLPVGIREPLRPVLNIPIQGPGQNVFYVGGQVDHYQVHIRIPKETELLHSVVLICMYRSNVELRFLSGEPWVVFHYRTEQEAVSLLKNLYRGVLKPLYLTRTLRTDDTEDSVAFVYTLNPAVCWDPITNIDVKNKYNVKLIQKALADSVKIYGNVFIQIPNMSELMMSNVPGTSNSWAGYIDMNSVSPKDALDMWKKSIVEFDPNTAVLGTREYFRCNFCTRSDLSDRSGESDNRSKEVVVFHQTTFDNVCAGIQFVTGAPVSYRIIKGHLVINKKSMEILEQRDKDWTVNSGLFKLLIEYYLRAGLDPAEVLKRLPVGDREVDYTHVSDSSKLQKTKMYRHDQITKNQTDLIATPFGFVAGLFNVVPTKEQVEDIIWSLKRAGGLYEMSTSIGPEGLYVYAHTTKQFTTEHKLRATIKSVFPAGLGRTVVSVISDGIDLDSLGKHQT